MHIRLGTPTDIAVIAGIELSASELFRATHMEWAVGETTAPAELATAIERGQFWVADVEGCLAGFLQANICDDTFHICEVAVHQAYRGQRIGIALMDVALAAARQRGHEVATLTTDRALPWNAPYYACLGFGIMVPETLGPELTIALNHLPNPHLRCAMMKNL